jgi:2',3'-cyclic-nucleotide 2'-phosphodiesterase (5'-nucleotidase family)
MSLSPRARRGRLSLVLTVLGIVALLVPLGAVSAKAPPKVVDVQILSLNDFHGQLEPASTSSSSGRIGA